MADDKKKMSIEQLNLIIEEVEKDPFLLTSKGSGKLEKITYVEKWTVLAKKLNSVENGTMRNVLKWQQAWRTWKSKTRKKASRAGGNCSQDLSSLENRFITLYNRQSSDAKSGIGSGGIDISSIIEVDPLSSDDSSDEQNGQVSVYTAAKNENGTPAEAVEENGEGDDGVTVKRRKVQLFPDHCAKKQTEILSCLTALEESRQEMEKRHSKVLEALAVALEQQADAVRRQTDAITRLVEVIERRAEREFH